LWRLLGLIGLCGLLLGCGLWLGLLLVSAAACVG
jgi:hypothetical protein